VNTKLVPLEPTEEMIEAGMEAFQYGQERPMSKWVRLMYDYMLTAAPSTDPVEPEVCEWGEDEDGQWFADCCDCMEHQS